MAHVSYGLVGTIKPQLYATDTINKLLDVALEKSCGFFIMDGNLREGYEERTYFPFGKTGNNSLRPKDYLSDPITLTEDEINILKEKFSNHLNKQVIERLENSAMEIADIVIIEASKLITKRIISELETQVRIADKRSQTEN